MEQLKAELEKALCNMHKKYSYKLVILTKCKKVKKIEKNSEKRLTFSSFWYIINKLTARGAAVNRSLKIEQHEKSRALKSAKDLVKTL